VAVPIHQSLIQQIKSAEALYHRLILLVGPSGSGKTAILQKVARSFKTSPVNVNLTVATGLLEMTERQRKLQVVRTLEEAIDSSESLLVLDNIEMLFEPKLQQDPLRLLQSLSRNITVVAAWNGTHKNGKLCYADPSHREYQSYENADALIVNMEPLTS
jgi:predicted ATP-binding protein involved in virulence